MKRHIWQRVSLCVFCGWWCPTCNDCACDYNGWVRYRTTRCPGFDTRAGADRPHRTP